MVALIVAEASVKSLSFFNGGVADKQVGKYNGGMKRSLSVAISLIGDSKRMGTPTQVCVRSCPNISAPAGRPFSTIVHCEVKEEWFGDCDSRLRSIPSGISFECMKRSSTKELLSPFENPKQTFRQRGGFLISKSRRIEFTRVRSSILDIEEQPRGRGQFLQELRDNTFSGSEHEDAKEHIEKVIEIVDLFPHPKEVILFYNGLDVPTRQIIDSKGSIPSKTGVDAKVAIQEMAEYS
ncbi:reverse transcriptase domain-containing protein [Tanacetum coccineum]